MIGEFSVYVFFPDETYMQELDHVDAKTAVEKAHSLTKTIGGRIGTTKQIMICDGDDYCVFLWRFGEGVVFPRRDVDGTESTSERKP
jgi:hypothetical protein